MKAKNKAKCRTKAIPPEAAAKILALRAKGLNLKAIGKAVHISDKTVSAFLKKNSKAKPKAKTVAIPVLKQKTKDKGEFCIVKTKIPVSQERIVRAAFENLIKAEGILAKTLIACSRRK